MNKLTQIFIAFLATFSIAVNAYAGTSGYVDYAPPSHSVPVFSDAMLVVLGLLFSVLAYRVLRTHHNSKPLASIAAFAIAVLSLFSGSKVIQEVYAAGYSMLTPAGGTIDVGGAGTVPILNSSGQAQQIINVRGAGGCNPDTPTSLPQCNIGYVVPNNQSCYVNFVCAGT